VTGRFAQAFTLAAVVAVLAGCGGGGGGSSSDPSSKNYDPADTTLKAAGLEVCSEDQVQPAKGLDSGAGVIAVRAFFVAKDCMGAEKTPNEIIVYQFDGRESLDAGLPKIRAAYPRGEVGASGPLVIVATGPDAAANLAAVQNALAGGSAS
jgi:hypothetical protein